MKQTEVLDNLDVGGIFFSGDIWHIYSALCIVGVILHKELVGRRLNVNQ